MAWRDQPWLHRGQPLPCLVRLYTLDCHSWSGPSGHFHHTIWLEPTNTCSGVRSSFFCQCHSAASSGWSAARELVDETCRPVQQGHPLPDLVRCSTFTCHSWSAPLGHFHQKTFSDPATILSGVRGAFFVGCHWAE